MGGLVRLPSRRTIKHGRVSGMEYQPRINTCAYARGDMGISPLQGLFFLRRSRINSSVAFGGELPEIALI